MFSGVVMELTVARRELTPAPLQHLASSRHTEECKDCMPLGSAVNTLSRTIPLVCVCLPKFIICIHGH